MPPDSPEPPSGNQALKDALRRLFGPLRRPVLHVQRTIGAGILVILPIGITALVLKFFFDLLDPVLQPVLDLLPGDSVTGLGLVALFILVYLLGLFAAQVVGRRLINVGHRVMEVIPLVKGIYGTTRMAVEILSHSGNGQTGGNGDGDTKGRQYSGVVLIDFPRDGIKSIGLITSTMLDTDGEEVLSVYVPTTPIPSSGFLVIVSASDVTRTDLSVEDALRVVISGGIRLDAVFRRSGFQVPGKTRSNQ
ncbi:MAG: DUF502 domain-containing protein [Chloroflexi bacterium]|nr:DUF502 domain-containing protein [Chloroflexota bacterium]MDA1270415.1 DUF502 domain-containing protein [Chloroflexota bacterium]PKB58924.1 MAG: hypothetical protein BZY83_04485 [SAR202 cluster bacterium Casp-Chloro-G2]